MTESDSSPIEVDSKGCRITKSSKISSKSHDGSSRKSRKSWSVSNVSNPIDVDAVNFLSSAEVVRDTIVNFDDYKKKMVESIGFGGLLHLPSVSSQDKDFSIWLLRSLKWFTGTLCIAQDTSIVLSAEHVGKIIGVNHSGIDVTEKSFESSSEKISFLKNRLSFLHTQSDILQAVQSFIEAPSPETINESYSDNFKVAFVIFAMGRFLAPGDNFSEGNSDFWGALQVPEAINCYNWSAYILSNILESARVLDWDIVYNRKLSPIACCTFILQIFYLDNVDFGPYNHPHNVFPRVKHYNNETMSRFIDAVRCKQNDSSSIKAFGRIKMFRKSNICYSFDTRTGTCAAPAGFGPNPPLYPNRIPKNTKHPRKRSLDHTPSANHGSCSNILPVVAPDTIPTDNAGVDLVSLINDNYPGVVGVGLIEAINRHQERCASHVTSLIQALKDSIAKENESLLTCIIQQINKVHGKPTTCSTPSPLAARIINHDGTLGSLDLSFSGTKSRRLSKMPHMESCHSTSEGSTERRENYFTPTSARSNSQELYMSRKKYSESCESSLNAPLLSIRPSPQTHRNVQRNEAKYSFETPEPPSKLCVSPQSFSPTTENKIFNGISLSARQINAMQSINLNARSFDAEYSSSPIVKKIANPGALALSHWSLALEAPALRDASTCAIFYKWLCTTTTAEELARSWIMHDSPRFIQIDGYQLRSEFTSGDPMTFPVFDIIVRRMKQIDRSIYLPTAPLRWRHFFESDLSLHVLGDDLPYENIAVRDQFTGAEVDYELCRCRMLFVPVLSNGVWWAYAFDMRSSTVLIMDPSNSFQKNETLLQMHGGTIEMIKQKLSATVTILFSGWNVQFNHFRPLIFRCNSMPCSRSDSGFFTLFLLSNINENCLMSEPSQPNLQNFKESILYEIIDLVGNRAPLPSAYVHVLD